MNLKTSNYGTARSLFGFVELLCWLGVGAGIIIALVSAGAASRGFGSPGVLAAVPGMIMSVMCLLGVVGVQIAKASVDSADYTYQMLAIARDQLAVSKQALSGSVQEPSFAHHPASTGNESGNGATFAMTAVDPIATEPDEWDYEGKRIHRVALGFLMEGKIYGSLDEAKAIADREAMQLRLNNARTEVPR